MSTTTTMIAISAQAKSASTSVTIVERKLPKIDNAVTKLDKDVTKLQDDQNNLKATIESPNLVTAEADLRQALSKIRVLEFRIKQETEEKLRYQKKFTEVSREALRSKNKNKSLIKTIAEQSLAIENIRCDVQEYIEESTASYKRAEAANDAHTAELEELLEVQRNDKYAQANKIQCVSTSKLWSN